MDLLKASVRPEFLNRIDEIVLFDPLSRENIRQIVDIQFAETKRRLAEQGITIDATVEVLDKLGEEGFDPIFGARPLKRVMQRRILNELSKLVLGNQISKDAVILMELDDNQEIKFVNVEETEVV
jgi:ATP-dependent Clp protease ATP-binding subunit ClpB